MASKKQLLLKSIRELLSLNVSGKEIVLNLKEVGINEEQAKKLIEEAKQPEQTEAPKKAVAKEVPFLSSFKKKVNATKKEKEIKAKEVEEEREKATEELAAEAVDSEKKEPVKEKGFFEGLSLKEIGKKASVKDSEEESAEVLEEKAAAMTGEKVESLPEPISKEKETGFTGLKTTPLGVSNKKQLLVEDIAVSKLWEKGLMASMSQKLAKMDELKNEIDLVLDKKVAEANKREMDKIKVLFDSQRALLISRVDTELETKAKSFADIIELKLREMREINKQTSVQIVSLNEAEANSKKEAEGLSRRLEDIDKVKENIVASLNTELIKSKTESKQLIEEMNKKLVEMDGRINKTLQLENQVVEGLVTQARVNVEKMLAEKSVEFIAESKRRVKEMREIKQQFEIEQKANVAKVADETMQGKIVLNKKIEQKLVDMDELHKQITIDFKPNEFKRQMNELNAFKVQFVEAIQQNAEKFNQGIKNLNNQSQVIERQFSLRAEKIDKKIAELDVFEKNFAKAIGSNIEKMGKKNNKKR